MNCCTPKASAGSGENSETVTKRCVNCHGQGRPVSRKTVLLMVKPYLLKEASSGTYAFCAASDCPVVYFHENGNSIFTTDDLRVIVGVKASTDPIPLCYCFGFDESDIRTEISQTGSTTIPETISRLIREGLCACEARNPSGVCCLGEVNNAAKRLKQEIRDLNLHNSGTLEV